MKISKAAVIVLILVQFSGQVLWAAEESKVVLEKKEGRMEALVSAEVYEERQAPKGFFGKTFYTFENAVMDTAGMVSHGVGKTTKIIVKGIGTAGGFVFSPLFKTIDLKGRHEKK